MGIKFVIGMDIGLRNCAVCVLDNVGTRQTIFNVQTKAGMNDHDSVDQIVEEVFGGSDKHDGIDKYIEEPSRAIVYIEDILFGTTGKGTARAEVTGVIKWNLRQQGVRIYGVTNSALNSFLFGKHNVKPAKAGRRTTSKEIKQCTKTIIDRHYGYYTKDDNIADAYTAAIFGHAHSIENRRFSLRALSRIV